MSGGAVTMSYASGSGTSTLVYNLSRTIGIGETGTISYTQPGSGVEDLAGNDLASIVGGSVTNNSTQDITVPTLSTATIATTGITISLVFDEAVQFGAGGNAGWVLTMSGGIKDGAVVTMAYASGSGTNTLVYDLSRKVFSDETGELDYTQPGNGVEDVAGNDLATISNRAVTNSSTQVWLPTEITGLALWLKADAITGLNNGDPVGTWPDSSGLGNDFSQSTAANKSIYLTNIQNGLPVVNFDITALTAARWMTRASGFLTGSSGTIIAVHKTNVLAVGRASQVVLASNVTADPTDSFVAARKWRNDTNPNIMIQQQNDDTADSVRGSTTINYSTWYTQIWSSNGTAYDFRVNGNNETETVIAGANNGDWFGDVTGLDKVILCALNASGTAYLIGYLGELIVYDGVTLTSTDFTNLETYLQTKWGHY